MKKVLIISYYWPPSGGAGVQRWLKFAKYLPGFEVDPIILTVDPHYASYPQIDESLEKDIPSDLKVYKTRSFEVLGFISELFGKDKIPYAGFSNVDSNNLFQVLLRFIRGNFFIPDARKGWNKIAYKKAVELIRQFDIDTIITTGPPHSTHLVGLKLKKLKKVRWIADFRDPWTDIYYYNDMLHTPIARKIDRAMEKRVIESADNVIAINKSVGKLLMSKTDDADSRRFSIITNGFDEDDFNFSLSLSEEFVITYSGTISEKYKPQVFFKVLARIIKLYPDLPLKFRLAGNISSSIEREIKEHGLHDIFVYYGYVNHEELARLLKSSTVLLYAFPETINYRGASGKLFEYLAAERPVISIDSTESDASLIIEECQAGKSFTREDEEGLFEYLEYLVTLFRKHGEVRAGNGMHLNYSRKKLTAELARLIKI